MLKALMDLGNRFSVCIYTHHMYLFRCVPNRNPARHLVGRSVDIIQWKCSREKNRTQQKKIWQVIHLYCGKKF